MSGGAQAQVDRPVRNYNCLVHGRRQEPVCRTCYLDPEREPLRGTDTPAAAELLTPTEREIVRRLAQAMNLWALVVGDGPTREQDLREFGGHVHDLQNAVLAQAAARAYPDSFRLAGRTLPAPSRT